MIEKIKKVNSNLTELYLKFIIHNYLTVAFINKVYLLSSDFLKIVKRNSLSNYLIKFNHILNVY